MRGFQLDLLGDPVPREPSDASGLARSIQRHGGEFALSLGPDGAKVRVGTLQDAITLGRERVGQLGRRYHVWAAERGQKRPAWHLAGTIDPGQPIDLTMLGSLLC